MNSLMQYPTLSIISPRHSEVISWCHSHEYVIVFLYLTLVQCHPGCHPCSYCWQVDLRPISQMVYQLIIQILKKNLLCSDIDSNGPVMLQFCIFSRCSKHKLVKWLHHCFTHSNKTQLFERFWLCAHKLFVIWVPRRHFSPCFSHQIFSRFRKFMTYSVRFHNLFQTYF